MKHITPTFVLASLMLAGCSGSLEDPVAIPKDYLPQIQGKLLIQKDIAPEITVYNGTEWNITSLDVIIVNQVKKDARKYRFTCTESEITKRNDQGAPIETREKPSSIAPYTTGAVVGQIGDYLDDITKNGDYSWSIDAAYGFKK